MDKKIAAGGGGIIAVILALIFGASRGQGVLQITAIDPQGQEIKGATVLIDQKEVGQTPCTYTHRSLKMATEGRDWIDLTVRKEGWQEATKEKVVVAKGNTAALPKKVEVRMDRG